MWESKHWLKGHSEISPSPSPNIWTGYTFACSTVGSLYPHSHRMKQRMVVLSERGHWIIQVELTLPTKLEFQASDGEKSNKNEILNWKSNLIFLWNHKRGLNLVNIVALHRGPINRISWSGSLTKRAFTARYCVSLTLINTCAFTCRV